jgi:DNA replication protein DnaC
MIAEATCTHCGAACELEIPDDLTEPWLSKLKRFPVACQGCADRREAQFETQRRAQEAADLDERIGRRRKHCGIPATLRDLDWDQVTPGNRPDVLAAARDWAAGDSSGLLLAGPVGVGKTWLAAAAAWERTRRAPLQWFSVPALFARLGLSFDSEERQAALSVLAGSRTLVLDDLDKVRPSAYAAEQIFTAIDNRVTAGTQLLITTNLRLGALEAKFPEPFGEAIASRLASYCQCFALEGSDRRLEAVA